MVILEFSFIFIVGAIGYGSIELLWRGHTHWTMLILGGICLYFVYMISSRMKDSLLKKAVMCTFTITALEFITGCIVNLRLGWNVWDYSSLPFNLMGQICPAFSVMWLALSLPCIVLSKLIYKLIFVPNMKNKRLT